MTIVLGGDTNQLDVKDLCQLTGWNSLVEFPTKGVAYLDNVLANRPDLFAINKNGSHGGHFTSGIKTQICLPKNSHPGLQKHRKEALYLELAGETWDSVLGTNDVDEANNLETLIHRHMDKCMPFRTVRISSRDPLWVTPLLKSLMRSKSRIGQNRGGSASRD